MSGDVMADVAVLYHWSPASRRPDIKRRGLTPGSLSTCQTWRPPMVCYADRPDKAWQMSGGRKEFAGSGTWDLWMVDVDELTGCRYEMVPYDDGTPREYRLYDRVPRKKLWRVGTRTA